MSDYLTCSGLTVGYDGVPLIRDITLEIQKGEIVTLIGPNGSGKSTILKSITRQLKALAGTVEVGSARLEALSGRELALRMAVVLTDRTHPELMTCRDVAAAGRYPHTGRMGLLTDADRGMVESALAAVRALDIADRDFNAISDGQRQRVLLARALCQQPEILVLDEPTSYLDVRHKLELLAILRRLAKEDGITIVLSLHEIDLAQKISDRVICVKGETIPRFGTPEEVFTEETIRELYGLDAGAYDPLFGSVELPRPQGAARALVLCGGGSGAPVFRRLQRRGVPFAAAVLYEGDVDCRLARRLAVETVEEAPFEPIGDAAFARAKALIDRCEAVIDARPPIGACNRRMAELIRLAEATGKCRAFIPPAGERA